MEDWKSDFINSIINGSHGTMLLLIHYGSGQKDHDLDYFAMFDGIATTESLLVGGMDLLAISRDVFFRYLRLMDPLVTEPLLTGKMVYGDSAIREKALSILNSCEPTQETIHYLLSRSFQEYIDAYKIGIEENEGDSRINRKYWSALSYSIGYWCFAHQYRHNQSKAAILIEIIDSMPPQIRTLWRKILDAKRAQLVPSLNILSEWIDILMK